MDVQRRAVLRNQDGLGMIQVMALAALIAGMVLYFSTRTISYQKNMIQLRVKDQIVTDRNLLKFDLFNRPLPSPTTPPP